MDQNFRKFPVQAIRINSYTFKPKQHVEASSFAITIIVPKANKNVFIDIPKVDIVKVASHFMGGECDLFISISKTCESKVEKCFKDNGIFNENGIFNGKMDQYEGLYQIMFRITSKYHCALSAIYLIFDPAEIEELDGSKEELDGCKEELDGSKEQLDGSEDSSPLLLIYPLKGPGGIPINREDYQCLSADSPINDVIIDFYLKYLHANLTDEQRNRTFIFGAFFYTKLAAEGHDGVKKWTKMVNLFEKDFIILPINIGNHWILAVICFPKSSTNIIEKSCILIFDSVPNDDESWNEMHVTPLTVKLRDYLTREFGAKFGESRTFNEENMPAYIVEVPQQDNHIDGGLYLLQYVENFFQDPIKDYSNIKVLNEKLCDWFDQNVINSKREYLSTLITELVKEYDPKKLPLPILNSERSDDVEDEDEESDEEYSEDGRSDQNGSSDIIVIPDEKDEEEDVFKMEEDEDQDESMELGEKN